MLETNYNTSASPQGAPSSSSDPFTSSENGVNNKRKRKPAGTPDPDAEVVSLSPKTLLESDRYICEICNQGFQRDQNLQMHRRRHKVPWKLLKRETQEVKKRVFVCPEPTCLHHDPCHALGDLVGIKKHFRRKHSNHKQWVCDKCNKGYAVQSDYKAHLKTCGTRGHSCDCGRVFSSTSPSSDANFSIAPPLSGLPMSKPDEPVFFFSGRNNNPSSSSFQEHNLELQLLPSSSTIAYENYATHLKLSIGSSDRVEKNDESNKNAIETSLEAARVKEYASEQLKMAMAEKAYAEEARQQAKRQIEMAELEFGNAKRIRQQAQAEVEKAHLLKEQATKKISSTIMQITCQACKHQFQASTSVPPCDEISLAMSYMSSATTEGEGE
ncbi:hypothetical protein EZV62_018318 [Acer yangbiense]|uniref:C2H2-type domain-containing protein n=1 Tax=Acer yangbiense TaxID=1000413 RepID=A0A5C7HJR1_9ROSI|nr:hypothetical protein EZV62_018318 [Acer yangbiense]